MINVYNFFYNHLVITLGIILFVVTVTDVAYKMEPTWLGFQREAFVASAQHVRATETAVLSLANNYAAVQVDLTRVAPDTTEAQALRAQAAAFCTDAKNKVAALPEDATFSADARNFANTCQ